MEDDPELDSFINKDSFSMMAEINEDDIAAGLNQRNREIDATGYASNRTNYTAKAHKVEMVKRPKGRQTMNIFKPVRSPRNAKSPSKMAKGERSPKRGPIHKFKSPGRQTFENSMTSRSRHNLDLAEEGSSIDHKAKSKHKLAMDMGKASDR